jgi:hypothetical protein
MKTTYIYTAKRLAVLLVIGTFGLAGCKKFLDVNVNPNNPVTASPNLLLPTVEAAIRYMVTFGRSTGRKVHLPPNIELQSNIT